MKTSVIVIFALLVLFSGTAHTQAVSWELSTQPGDQAFNSATFQGSNFDNNALTRGPGVNAVTAAGSMNSSSWFEDGNPTTLTQAIDNDDYYEFTINTINCLFFNPTTIKIVLQSSDSGPNKATLRCSSDGFTANIGTVTVSTTSTEFTFSETISPNSQSVTFRLYGYGDAADGGTPSSAGTMRIGSSAVAADNDLELFASSTFVAVSSVSDISVHTGDFVPSIALNANVPGASVDWIRTSQSIGLGATGGSGDIPAFTAFNPTGTALICTLTVNATAGSCTGPDMVFRITVEPAVCNITVDFFGTPGPCNDNNTPNDPSDDFFTQNVHASFFNRPFTGSLQIVAGGDAIGTYSILANQIVGNAHTFNDVHLKADGTPTVLQMNFTDDPSCIDEGTGPTVQSCSGAASCEIIGFSFANISSCNNNGTTSNSSDDFFTVDVEVLFSNPFGGATSLILNGTDVVAQVSTPAPVGVNLTHTFTGVKLKADGQITNFEGSIFNVTTLCSLPGTGPAVNSCSSGPPTCSITGLQFANLEACSDNGTPNDPTDDFYIADIFVSFENPPATGFLSVSGPDLVNGDLQVSIANVLANGSPFPFSNKKFRADGLPTSFLAKFTDAPGCIASVSTINGVGPCSSPPPPCDITGVTFQNVGTCDNNGTADPTDDFFPADVVVNFANPPATGDLQIEPGGDAFGTHSVSVGSLVGNSHTFVGVHFKADGTQTIVEVEFTIPANQCVQTQAGPTVQSCSPVCDISSVSFQNIGSCDNNGTADPSDDFFPADVVVTFVNPPATGSLQIEPGGDAFGTNSVSVGSLVGNSHSFVGVHFKADGTQTVAEVEFTVPANQCVQTQTGPTVNSCANLVTNPGFESGTSPWVFFTNGTGGLSLVSPGHSSPNAARVTLTTTGSNMQLYQFGITLQPGTQYRLTFKALSSVGHNLTVSLGRHDAPYTNYGLNNHLFDVTPSWATYTVDFTTVGFPPPTPSNARLRFAFNGYASSGDVYFIDDVSLVQLGSTLTATKVRVETAPDGGGSVVPSQTIENGNTIIMYAISRTATDQFVANVSAAWSLQNIVPNVILGDLVPSGDGKSAVFTGNADGSAKVQAISGVLTPVPSDVITVFTPPPVTNLLVNGGFESGTVNWTFQTNGTGTFTAVTPGTVGAKAGQIAIATQGTAVQLFQQNITLISGGDYHLSFKAKSTTGHDVQASVFKHGSPFTPYGLTNQFFNLTNAWADYSIDFTAGGFVGTVSDARLRLWFAPYDAAGDIYQFDDVKIELLPAPPDAEEPNSNSQIPTEFTLAQNFPNPFNPSTTIIYTLPLDARVTLDVYDVLGQRVAQLVDGMITAGYHDAVFDASTLSSGLYLYRLTAVGTDGVLFSKTEKMILAK